MMAEEGPERKKSLLAQKATGININILKLPAGSAWAGGLPGMVQFAMLPSSLCTDTWPSRLSSNSLLCTLSSDSWSQGLRHFLRKAFPTFQ